MVRRSKCNACMKTAKEQHSIQKLSKQYTYQLLRDKCQHTKEEREGTQS